MVRGFTGKSVSNLMASGMLLAAGLKTGLKQRLTVLILGEHWQY